MEASQGQAPPQQPPAPGQTPPPRPDPAEQAQATPPAQQQAAPAGQAEQAQAPPVAPAGQAAPATQGASERGQQVPPPQEQAEATEEHGTPAGAMQDEEVDRSPARDQSPVASDAQDAITGDPGFGEQVPQTSEGGTSAVDRPVGTSMPSPEAQSGMPLPEERAAAAREAEGGSEGQSGQSEAKTEGE